MGRRLRVLLLSVVAVCISAALIVGGTYALFSDQVIINNHLQSGSLEIGLERVGYQICTLEDDGTLGTSANDTTVVDLTKDASTLFHIDKAVPGSWCQAEIKVTRMGDVAIDYGVRFIWNEENDATAEQKIFAQQLRITVTQAGTEKAQFVLSEAVDVGLGSILVDDGQQSQNFTVKVEFVDSDKNYIVQAISLDFDLQVYATQKITND